MDQEIDDRTITNTFLKLLLKRQHRIEILTNNGLSINSNRANFIVLRGWPARLFLAYDVVTTEPGVVSDILSGKNF